MKRTPFLLALLPVLLHTGAGFADAPRGTYSLTSDGTVRADAKFEGNPLPSCGPDAEAVLKDYSTIVLTYSEADKAEVNGETWSVLPQAARGFFVREPERSELTLRALQSGKRASGTLVFMRVEPAKVGKPVCASTLQFRGSFKKS